ncbi:MAG TPA: hypothetical protein PKD90_15695, partial [Phnomibacter sp.]|nr:hypothetical protein [Phnomibacter sp.]
KNKTVLIIEGQRQNWNPAPLAIVSYSFEFLDSLNLSPIILANAFEIRQVPYCWKKGKLETWQ